MKLTPNFTLEELCVSQYAKRKGISNMPAPREMEALRHTALGLERIRALVGLPIVVSSGYRNSVVNSAIGGAATSQHMKGEAADIRAIGMTCRALAEAIRDSAPSVDFDQLILEYPEDGWVHVSFVTHRNGRRQVITKFAEKPYLQGLVKEKP